MMKFCFYLFFVCCVASLNSQVNKVIDKSLVLQSEIFIPELKCIEGKKLIESFLIKNQGIIACNTDIIKKTIKVSYIKTLTSFEEICVLISNTGYQADTFSANKDAMKLLPICCLDTFTENTVRLYYEMEREAYKKAKKRFRIPKKFICCKSCDIVAKYRNLKR